MRNTFTLVAASLFVMYATTAIAVIIATGDGTGNTTAPSPEPGWYNNVGIGLSASSADLTAVYLRNGWVITAGHAGPRSIKLLGVTYAPVPGSTVNFRPNDLILYKLLDPKPPLPDLAITDAAPVVDTLVTMSGNGLTRHRASEFGAGGWLVASPHVMRWGTQHILSTPNGPPYRFITSFHDLTDPGPVPAGEHECQASGGDSGGGVFTGSGETAELIGIMSAVSKHQPQAVIYGDATFSIDLFPLRTDILAVIDVPDCNNGLDDDGDGVTDFPNDRNCLDASGASEYSPSGGSVDNGIPSLERMLGQ
jgi:hypothetical protein